MFIGIQFKIPLVSVNVIPPRREMELIIVSNAWKPVCPGVVCGLSRFCTPAGTGITAVLVVLGKVEMYVIVI